MTSAAVHTPARAAGEPPSRGLCRCPLAQRGVLRYAVAHEETAMTDDAIRGHITAVLIKRATREDDRRHEALRDFLAMTSTAPDTDTAERLAELVPPILPELYAKWIAMFIERLFETVDRGVLEMLCDGSEDNDAALLLSYVMFLESERMERQIDEDLAAYGLEMTGADAEGDLAASFIRSRIQEIAREQQVRDTKTQ